MNVNFSQLFLSYMRADFKLTDILLIIIAVIICCLFIYVKDKIKTNGMYKKLGFSTKEEYHAYKQSCQLNHRNRFCMSDEWVINEYSYKFYHTSDIISASPTHKMKKGSKQYDRGYIYGIIIRYHGGTDSFTINGLDARDRLLRNINEFLKCRLTGKSFVQNHF